MVLWFNKYFSRLLLTVGFIFMFGVSSSAQLYDANIVGRYSRFNPFLLSAFKKLIRSNPLLLKYIKPTRFELMYWPNYPLTAAQIQARDKEWDRENNQSPGQQIAGEIMESAINNLINGRKSPVANRPKF